MPSHSFLPEPSPVEPVAVLSGAGTVAVRLVDAAGRGFTLCMADASAQLLAALLAAGKPCRAGALAKA